MLSRVLWSDVAGEWRCLLCSCAPLPCAFDCTFHNIWTKLLSYWCIYNQLNLRFCKCNKNNVMKIIWREMYTYIFANVLCLVLSHDYIVHVFLVRKQNQCMQTTNNVLLWGLRMYKFPHVTYLVFNSEDAHSCGEVLLASYGPVCSEWYEEGKIAYENPEHCTSIYVYTKHCLTLTYQVKKWARVNERCGDLETSKISDAERNVIDKATCSQLQAP